MIKPGVEFTLTKHDPYFFRFEKAPPLPTTLLRAFVCPHRDSLRNMRFAILSLSTLNLLYPLPLVLAHGGGAPNGMDMSMDGAMSLTGANMVPYLHFSPGDTLWFLGWVPLTKGAMAGTCIGLFLLALVDRWLAAIRATAENHWRSKARILMANKRNSSESVLSMQNRTISGVGVLRNLPPFIPAHDITRGVLHAGQAALGFALMLVVMTFQGAFIISIVLGLGVGEIIFGRSIGGASGH